MRKEFSYICHSIYNKYLSLPLCLSKSWDALNREVRMQVNALLVLDGLLVQP